MKIEECRSVKYLGVLIDEELKFTDHINRVSKKISKAIGIVSKLRHFVSKEVTLLYYNLYIKPVIQYGILVYGGTYKVHLNKVATMQRKLLRLMFFKRTGSVETEMKNAQILSVPQLYVYDMKLLSEVFDKRCLPST